MCYVLWIFCIMFCTHHLRAIESELRTLQHSLEQLKREMPAQKLQREPFMASLPEASHFNEKFLQSVGQDIALNKGKSFTLSITKEKEEDPTWSITPGGSYAPLVPKSLFIDNVKYNDIFDAIIARTSKARMIFADENFVVFFSQGYVDLTKQPIPPKHNHKDESTVLVVPRKHIVDITELGKVGDLKALFEECAKIAALFGEAEHYSFEINRGAGKQEVPHVHAHLTLYHKKPLWEPLFAQKPYETRREDEAINYHFKGYK